MSDNPPTRTHRIEPEKLDPIIVYVEEIRPGASRITVQCYARAWTAYWGAHGDETVEQFIRSCTPDYVADNLAWGISGTLPKRVKKSEHDYLVRIVQAIQHHFSKQLEPLS